MINQRAYPDVILGFGKQGQTVAALGCFECSLLQGVLDRGYSFTVPAFNQLLKDKGCFDSRTLLNSNSIGSKIPEIFYEGRIEAWDDAKFIKYLSDPSYIILGEVDARGIGGSGQHFVYVQRADIENGKIKMTYIGDPWDGLDDQKVSTRYNRYGNILSLRVFRVHLKENQPPQDGQTMTYKGIDLNNTESVKVAIDMWDAVVKQGLYIKKTEHEAAQKELGEELEARYSDRFTAEKLKIVKLISQELGLPDSISDTSGLISAIKSLIDQSNNGGSQNGSQSPTMPKSYITFSVNIDPANQLTEDELKKLASALTDISEIIKKGS